MKNKEKEQAKVPAVEQKMDRKQAIKKAGLYAASAAGMIMLLGAPNKSASAASFAPPPPPVW